jgi:hypothetical protein
MYMSDRYRSLPSTDIDPRAKALWPIFVSHDENDPDMEKEMHNLYLSGNYRDMNITSSFLMWRWPIYKDAVYHVIRLLPEYMPMGWYRCDTSGVYVFRIIQSQIW